MVLHSVCYLERKAGSCGDFHIPPNPALLTLSLLTEKDPWRLEQTATKNNEVSSVSLLVHWLPKDKWMCSLSHSHPQTLIQQVESEKPTLGGHQLTQAGNWYRAHQADLAQWLPKRPESWLLHWCVTTSRVANIAEVMIYFHKSQPSVAVTPLKMPQITANRQESFFCSHSSSILSQHGLEICEKSKSCALSNSAKEEAEIIILNFQ